MPIVIRQSLATHQGDGIDPPQNRELGQFASAQILPHATHARRPWYHINRWYWSTFDEQFVDRRSAIENRNDHGFKLGKASPAGRAYLVREAAASSLSERLGGFFSGLRLGDVPDDTIAIATCNLNDASGLCLAVRRQANIGRLVAGWNSDGDRTALGKEILDIAKAQGKAEIQPDGMLGMFAPESGLSAQSKTHAAHFLMNAAAIRAKICCLWPSQ